METEKVDTRMQRSLRKQRYKQLLDEGAQLGLQAEITDPLETFQAVKNILEESNVLQNEGRIKDRAENATEVLMDAQVLKMSHDVVHATMQKMGNSEFSDDEFAGILSNLEGDRNVENWYKITREAASVFHMTRHSQSLFGTFEHEPIIVQKETKARATRQKQDFGQAKKPETVDKLQKREKSAHKLNLIFNQIVRLCEQRKGPIPYYELIVDPDDFMATVDNAFQISFLLRDGRVALLQDENFDPIIRPTLPKENEQAQRMTETTQAILGLNPGKWRALKERYEVEEPLLKLNREELDMSQMAK